MIPVPEDRAPWASHDLVQPLCGADAERLHHSGERWGIGGLDEHMDVVALDREMGETRVAPLQAPVERTLEHHKTSPAAQIPDLGPHPHGDVERLARIDLTRHVRDACGVLPGPGPLPALPSGRLETKIE